MKTNIELAREAGFAMENSAAIQAAENLVALVESRYRERLLAGAGEPFRYWVDIGGTFTTLAGAEEWAEDIGTPVITLYTADTLAAAVLRERTECADECDELASFMSCHGDKDGAGICTSMAESIRNRGTK